MEEGWTFKTATVRRDLNRLLAAHNLDASLLCIVPSVHQATLSEGLRSDRERVARTIWDEVGGKRIPRKIMLRETVSQGDVDGSSVVMHLRYEVYLRLRERPELFAKHTVLHEIAHLLGIDDEADADRWAFEQLANLGELAE